jgi:hypothetical protein
MVHRYTSPLVEDYTITEREIDLEISQESSILYPFHNADLLEACNNQSKTENECHRICRTTSAF